jgi:hypothetical protein
LDQKQALELANKFVEKGNADTFWISSILRAQFSSDTTINKLGDKNSTVFTQAQFTAMKDLLNGADRPARQNAFDRMAAVTSSSGSGSGSSASAEETWIAARKAANASRTDGRTVLMSAVIERNKPMVEYIVSNFPNLLNSQTLDNKWFGKPYTALDYANHIGLDDEIITLLRSKNALALNGGVRQSYGVGGLD